MHLTDKERPAGLHEGAHSVHVVLVGAVPLPPETVEQLVTSEIHVYVCEYVRWLGKVRSVSG